MSVIGRLVSAGPGARLLRKLLPEQNGHSYGLTVLTPVRRGTAPGTGAEEGAESSGGPTGIGRLARRDVTHASALRAKLRALPNGSRARGDVEKETQSPFARLPGTHLARWVVLDDVPFLAKREGYPAEKEDHLRSQYLLFTSNFDGDLGPYLDAMWRNLREEVADLYGHCEGFEEVEDADSFRKYMEEHKIFTTFFFSARPDLTRDRILRALDTQRRVARFIVEQQKKADPAGLKADFDQLVAEVRKAETPAPGAL